MWKIFRCKRGEERSFIPGKHLDESIALSSEKGFRNLINKIKEFEEKVYPKIKVMEDKEKFFVQYQIEVKEGKTYYNTFLEISKYKRFRSFDAFKAGESPEFKTTIHECIPTKEVIKVFDILESVHSIY